MRKYAIDRQNSVINNFKKDVHYTNDTVSTMIEKNARIKRQAGQKKFTDSGLTQSVLTVKPAEKFSTPTAPVRDNVLYTFKFDKSYIPSGVTMLAIIKKFRELANEIKSMDRNSAKYKTAMTYFLEVTNPVVASKIGKKLDAAIASGNSINPMYV